MPNKERQVADELRALYRQVVSAQEVERNRLARDFTTVSYKTYAPLYVT